jgi:hypothetical protein
MCRHLYLTCTQICTRERLSIQTGIDQHFSLLGNSPPPPPQCLGDTISLPPPSPLRVSPIYQYISIRILHMGLSTSIEVYKHRSLETHDSAAHSADSVSPGQRYAVAPLESILTLSLPFISCYNTPTGRLHQVEYAIEAINNAGTCVGLLCDEVK